VCHCRKRTPDGRWVKVSCRMGTRRWPGQIGDSSPPFDTHTIRVYTSGATDH
jgi:hypothetical protein